MIGRRAYSLLINSRIGLLEDAARIFADLAAIASQVTGANFSGLAAQSIFLYSASACIPLS